MSIAIPEGFSFMDAPTTETLLPRPEVQRRTGLGRTSLYALMARGDFPKSVKVTTTAVRWLESEVAAWIASRPRAGGVE